MSGSDPLRIVWDALEAAGWDPHGPLHGFRARCPAHNGGNRDALHVSVGADGRAVVHCFAHRCRSEDIVRAVGLDMRDLFPAGHRHARRRHLREAGRSEFTGPAREVVNVLAGLEGTGLRWRAMVQADCPYCGGVAWLRTNSWAELYLDCSGGCTADEFKRALAGRLEEGRAA